MSCEQCGINLTGMAVAGAGHMFCCERHRAQWFARVPASGAPLDSVRVATHPAIDRLLADIRSSDAISAGAKAERSMDGCILVKVA